MEEVLLKQTWIVVSALAVLFLIPAGATVEGEVTGALKTSGQMHIGGPADVSGADGIVHVYSDEEPTAELTAEKVSTKLRWEEGIKPGEGRGDNEVSTRTNSGVKWFNATEVKSRFPGLQPPSQFLAIPDQTVSEISGDSATVVESIDSRQLTRVWLNDTASTYSFTGFWYSVDSPKVAAMGADQAKIVGNFTLFVNNVTIQVTHSDQGAWSNWTGYKESNPDSPAGPIENPAAKAYEVHVATLRVTNGTLWVNATDAVDLYARDANATVDGAISAPSVSGELLTDPLRYAYDGDPLRLWGQGSLGLGLASERPSDEAARAPGSSASAPALTLAPSGTFDVQPAQGVEVHEAETTSLWDPGSWWGTGAWLALAFVATALASVVVGATVPQRVHTLIGVAVGGWRERQYNRWLHEAELLLRKGDDAHAARVAKRGTSLLPTASGAWLLLARARFRSGNQDRALAAAREGRRAVEETSVELLDLCVTYAAWLDASEQAVQAWLELSEVDPERALWMYVEEEFDVLAVDERVHARVDEIREELAAEDPEMAAFLRDRAVGRDEDGNGDGEPGPEIA